MPPRQRYPDRRSRDALVEAAKALGSRFDGDRCQCPFHSDGNPSANVFCGDDSDWRLHCHACEKTWDVYDCRNLLRQRTTEQTNENDTVSIKLPASQALHPQAKVAPTYPDLDSLLAAHPWATKHYRYCDAEGHLVLVVLRGVEGDGSKRIRQATPIANDHWIMKGLPEKMLTPLYALPEIISHRIRLDPDSTVMRKVDGERVIVVEGEKCADALRRIGFIATTSCGGAKRGDRADWSPLAGRQVYIFPDHDEAGAHYADTVVHALRNLPEPPALFRLAPADYGIDTKGADIADLIEAWTKARLTCAVQRARIETLLPQAMPVSPTSDLLADIDVIATGARRRVEWHCPYLAAVGCGLRPGTITLFVGGPGVGKSTFLYGACTYWTTQGHRAALLALEMSDGEHRLRSLSNLTGITDVADERYVEECSQDIRDLAEKHRAQFDRLHRIVTTQTTMTSKLERPDITYDDVLTWVGEQMESGVQVAVVDPITMIDNGDQPWQADKIFMAKLSTLISGSRTAVVLVTHHARGATKPCMATIAGGQALSRHADVVLWLHAPEKRYVKIHGNDVETKIDLALHLLKVRAGKGAGQVLALQRSEGLRFESLGFIKQEEDDYEPYLTGRVGSMPDRRDETEPQVQYKDAGKRCAPVSPGLRAALLKQLEKMRMRSMHQQRNLQRTLPTAGSRLQPRSSQAAVRRGPQRKQPAAGADVCTPPVQLPPGVNAGPMRKLPRKPDPVKMAELHKRVMAKGGLFAALARIKDKPVVP
jgi:hypothetical protein